MRHRFLLVLSSAIVLTSCAAIPRQPSRNANLPGTGEDAGQTVVYRDTWGVPHIYAPAVENGLYAMGWAQAEDRPEELLKNFARGMGESSRFEGERGLEMDSVARMWDHYGVAKRNEATIRPELRAHIEAYVRGINDFYDAHPKDVPEWWENRDVDIYMVIAFGRLFLYSWSIDDGFGDLERGGIKPGVDIPSRGSNQFAVAPSRSASGAAILCIDPHLAWWGPSRFWEVRIHAGEMNGSGFTLPGQPYIALGHNADVAWAMTTGGPDTADVYELTLNPDNALQYKYEGQWRDITQREEIFYVKDVGEKRLTLYESHYGPVVAIRGGKAYAIKTSYAEIVNGNEAWYQLNFARDYRGAIAALDTLTVFPQNVMVADTSGNIYYQRTGRVPIRPEGYDWSKPVHGSTAATEWSGVHPTSDHVQVLNPSQGWMQNCNVPPDTMMIDSPMQPERYPSDIFGDAGYGPRGGWINERGARAIQLLRNDDSVTSDEAQSYALDMHPFGVERWLALLQESDAAFGADFKNDANYVAGIKEILDWDMQLRQDSAAALKYYYWRKQIIDDLGRESADALREKIDQHYLATFREAPPSPGDDPTKRMLAASLQRAMAALHMDYGRLDAVYGDKFRVGRDDKSWPAGGGGDREITGRTMRSMSYGEPREDGTRWGHGGQTSTQIVVLTKPIRSWTQPPIGQSDRPESPHYCDQAERVFGPARMKPTWWLPEDLRKHVESREVLDTQ